MMASSTPMPNMTIKIYSILFYCWLWWQHEAAQTWFYLSCLGMLCWDQTCSHWNLNSLLLQNTYRKRTSLFPLCCTCWKVGQKVFHLSQLKWPKKQQRCLVKEIQFKVWCYKKKSNFIVLQIVLDGKMFAGRKFTWRQNKQTRKRLNMTQNEIILDRRVRPAKTNHRSQPDQDQGNFCRLVWLKQ